jgi:hypothetical protein
MCPCVCVRVCVCVQVSEAQKECGDAYSRATTAVEVCQRVREEKYEVVKECEKLSAEVTQLLQVSSVYVGCSSSCICYVRCGSFVYAAVSARSGNEKRQASGMFLELADCVELTTESCVYYISIYTSAQTRKLLSHCRSSRACGRKARNHHKHSATFHTDTKSLKTRTLSAPAPQGRQIIVSRQCKSARMTWREKWQTSKGSLTVQLAH